MNLLLVFIILLAIRLTSVFLVQTFYVPDEYWQSLEVAHKITFGYGHLTWEWVQGIRSYIYPLIFAVLYKVLALFQLDHVNYLILLPRVLQATLSAFSDYRFYVWCGSKKWALFLIAIPWFWFYTGSRTLTNTLEASLTTIALSYFPWQKEGTSYLWLAALSCFIRPTAAIIWIPLCIYHLTKTRLSIVELILKRFLLIGLLVAGFGVFLDTYIHGSLIVTPYEFLKYNLLQGIGSFYGTQPWYWYFAVGLPTVLGINTLPFIFGAIETIRHSKVYPIRKQLLITILVSLIALSFIEHKEFRFVSSLLPLCLYIVADTLTRWSYKASRFLLWLIALVILLANVYPAWYLGTIHQRGPIEVMSKLQEISKDYRDESNHRASVLFLMPCHSTPYYSHIHENVTLRFLTCEPNLKKTESYLDEADQFYEKPDAWLRYHIPSYPKTAMPTHVVLYEPLAAKISEFLLNYRVLHKVPNGEYVQPRTGRNVLVYQRIKSGEENLFNKHENDRKVDPVVNADEIANFERGSYPGDGAGGYGENDLPKNLFN